VIVRSMLVALALVVAACGGSGIGGDNGAVEQPDEGAPAGFVDCAVVAAYEDAGAWKAEAATKSRPRQESAHAAWVEAAEALMASVGDDADLEEAFSVLITDSPVGVTSEQPSDEFVDAAEEVASYLDAAAATCAGEPGSESDGPGGGSRPDPVTER
jgi:hypothetical protein